MTPFDAGMGSLVKFNHDFIDRAFIQEGRELKVLWGAPGTTQMEVRATVAHHPYNVDLIRNEDRDVSDIPTFDKA